MKVNDKMFDKATRTTVRILSFADRDDPRFKGTRGVLVHNLENGTEETVPKERLCKIP